MIDINLYKINKNFGFDILFNNLNIEIKHGEHIAIIGDNGSGKTTLLNIIAGVEKIDSGTISIRNNISIGYLKQIQDNKNLIVKEVLYQGLQDMIFLKEQLDKLEQELDDKNINEYLIVQNEFINLGGYELESKIGKVLDIFNIKNDLINRKFNDLSGGEKTIISLISILLNNPDILLLDEPTNHLDVETLNWLEEYLNSYKGTIIMVSHDRYFLNKLATKIILLENKNIDIYHGNYNYYLEEYKIRKELKIKKYNNQTKLINKMEQSIKQLKEFGKIGDNEDLFRRANSIQKRLDKMDRLDKPKDKKNIPINFNVDYRSGKEVIKISNLTLSLNNKILINDINMDILYRDRICIMGSNGCGKSTLIKEILKNNNCIKIGTNVNIGYIPQEIRFDNENLTIIEEARKYYIGDESHLRSSLNKFLFIKENIFKKIGKLSGGEKIRLKLFCLMQEKFNVLILDEPTNHIDIFTKELLESALLKYDGTLIFISHDRYFINKLATKIVYISNKKLNAYIGNYDDNINKIHS